MNATPQSKRRMYAHSAVLGRRVTLSGPMIDAVTMLELLGHIRTTHGIASGTICALMNRGLLREADRKGRHYPATTPAQVEAEAHVNNSVWEQF